MARKQTAKKSKASRRPAKTAASSAVSPAPTDEQPSSERTFPVCGIGASAGGLEAFTHLLGALPADTGMGFVLVQHLDPKHESLLTTLLSRATPMHVHEVTDGMRVMPNHVYVIPKNRDMSISDGVLHLLPRPAGYGRHMPVDFFFRSLAQDMGSRAIGVILSGSAYDGVLGMKAIKAEGGFTFAQDEKSAKYDSMPRAAASAGAVDFVLPPQKIAVELARIGKHPILMSQRPPQPEEIIPEEGDSFHKILAVLRTASGVDFTHYKHSTIKRRIARRMVMLTISAIEHYVAYLRKHPAEAQALCQDILIHVTGFFRDPDVFRALKSKIFPRILATHPKGSPLRVWVPGCSTGEEAYSIAISLLEFVEEVKGAPLLQIFGTDVSEAAIDKARLGIYLPTIASEVSAERLRRFFVKLEGGSYQISKLVRDVCVFAKQDVTKDPPLPNMDLISCRNMLIYLGPVLQKRALAFLNYSLRSTGFLVLGASETISVFGDLFEIVDHKYKLFVKKQPPRQIYLEFGPEYYGRREVPGVPGPPSSSGTDLNKEIDRILLSKYAPAAILVNEKLDILQFRGRTNPYLEPVPGEASLNLRKMARESLFVELSTAISRAKKGDAAVRKDGVRFHNGSLQQEVNIEVKPVELGKERCFLILFEEVRRPATSAPTPLGDKKTRVAPKSEDERVSRLQQELKATNEYLQSVIESQETTNEELRSAYEEIQSSNEELQSVNEELETAKEELQATNEELTTVNETMQNKNLELGQLSNDLTNLLASTNVPIVMLGSDLRIRRFTPTAERVLNLIASDVGRSISSIKPKVQIPDLEQSISEVLETLHIRELEVQDVEGRWYSLRIRPYRTAGNRIDGAVLVFHDVDTLKTSLDETSRYAEAIVETVRQPLLVLDAELRVKRANPAFYEMFNLSAQEAENQFIYSLGGGEWNSPRLRLLLQETLSKNARFDHFEVDMEVEHLGRRALLLSGRRLQHTEGQPGRVLLVIQDVTERREAAEIRYRRLFQEAKDGLLIADGATGQITDVNRALTELLGFTRSELLLSGRTWQALLWRDGPEKWQRALEQLDSGQPARFESARLETKDGRQVDADCVCNMYKDGDRKMIQCSVRDVTEHRRAEELTRKALKEKELLIKEVHHRVKNNLQIIYSLLNLQARYIKDQVIASLFRESQNRVKSMALIHEELYRSKDLANIDFREYLRKLANSLIHTYGLGGDRVRINIEAENIVLRIDTAIPCGLVVNELVSNSMKHAFPGDRKGEVWVRLQAEGDHNYLLSVADNGVGLPADIDVRDTKTLGLQLVNTLGDQLGAKIEVKTGEGTEFAIRFADPEPPQAK